MNLPVSDYFLGVALMRIDEGKLRAYLDQALPLEELEIVKKQLAGSLEAQAVPARLSQERDDFAPYLAALAPPPEERSAAPQTLRRWQAQITGPSSQFQITDIKERIKTMFNRSFIKRHQPVLAILTVVAIMAISFSFAPVRAVARDFLKIFRVQTIRVVQVDREQMEALRDNPNLRGLIDKLEAQIKVITDDEPQKVDSLDEAAELVGYPVAQITALPEDVGEPSITVYQEKVVHLQLDKDLLEAIFEAAEIEVDLPDSLNEEPIVVTQPNTVIQKWHQEGQVVLEFVQMSAPAIEYPDDLDLNALGVAGLQLLGMSKEEAEALAATIDWANTIILPIPNDSEVMVAEVSINGANGLLFVNPDEDEDGAAVTWMQNGMSYFINGDYSTEQTVEMAESVK
jgi:acid stress-induced BolA-like protein IbaG/YrbA